MTSAEQSVGPTHNTRRARQDYYDRIAAYGLSPAWERLRDLIAREPKSQCVPAIWRFNEVKAVLMESAELISAEEAERRVLLLENPGLPGQSRITQTLLAGLQLIMPGEIAAGHRHSASSIRFILDGENAYTTVEGERTSMSPGDFILTPNWSSHDHGNMTDEPMIWLDVLDVPIINYFETTFCESFDCPTQAVAHRDGDSIAFFGSGVLPDGAAALKSSPIINYPYARTRPILERLRAAGRVDERHGVRVRYANPTNGEWTMPTMGAHVALLPAGFRGGDYRATDGTIFVCVEGCGSTRVGDRDFEWRRGDIFVAPPWLRYAHATDVESVLFSISDRPAQEALGIWREIV
jgi:gentisate 1,2-dioxygenase